jgi:hypothetical protein
MGVYLKLKEEALDRTAWKFALEEPMNLSKTDCRMTIQY